jgi:SPP1 family predicted phage head-tail adaptor
MPSPSPMKHRVTVQENSPTRNTYGELVDSWGDVETVYAAVEPLDGAKFLGAGRMVPVKGARFRMRYRSDLGTADTEFLSKYRLSYGSRFWAIKGVVEGGASDRWVTLLASEVN